MTNGTVVEGARVALQSDVLQIIVRLIGRQDGVRAAVAGFTVEAAVSHRIAIAFARILGKLSRVASGAAREIDPRSPSRIRHLCR